MRVRLKCRRLNHLQQLDDVEAKLIHNDLNVVQAEPLVLHDNLGGAIDGIDYTLVGQLQRVVHHLLLALIVGLPAILRNVLGLVFHGDLDVDVEGF